MPQNIEAEIATLASILIGGAETLAAVADGARLRPAHFYREAHRHIYAAMLALRAQGRPPDLLLVCDRLETAGQLEDVGGMAEVSALSHHVPHSGNAAHYAEIIRRHAHERALMGLGARITATAYGGADLAEPVVGWMAELDDLLADQAPREAATSRYRLLSVADMLSQPRPDPLIDHHLSLNSTGMLYGPSGVGKSVLLLDMLAHVALGRPWRGCAVHGGHVVYVCAEGAAFMGERLRAWMALHKLSDIPRLHILPAAPQLLEPATVPDLVAAFSAQLPEQPVWVVFDTVSQTSRGANENDPSEMAQYVGAMERMREATGAHVLAVHHTGKDESRGLRGASSLYGNVDSIIEIAKQGATAVMRCDKQRGGWKPFDNYPYRVRSVLIDETGEHTGPVAEAVDAPDVAGAATTVPDNYRRMLATLKAAKNLTHGEFQAACGVPRSSFNRGLDYLESFQLIQHDTTTGAYTITTKGASLVPRESHGSPTGLARGG